MNAVTKPKIDVELLTIMAVFVYDLFHLFICSSQMGID